MKSGVLAKRYAKALFSFATENKTQDRVLNELRALVEVFCLDPEVARFFDSPMIPASEKLKCIKTSISESGVSSDLRQFLLVLADKGRLPLFGEIVEAFQEQIDASNGVCRGNVRSTTPLAPAERLQIEQTVEKVLRKKVIMTYKIDSSVIGGLVAQVGSFTFDDSLSSHLKRMGDELKRRTI